MGHCLWWAQLHRSGGHRNSLLLLLRHMGCLLSMPLVQGCCTCFTLGRRHLSSLCPRLCLPLCVPLSRLTGAAAAEVCPTLPCVQVLALPSLEPLQQFSLAACLGFAWSWQEDAFPTTSLHSLCALAADGQLAMVRQHLCLCEHAERTCSPFAACPSWICGCMRCPQLHRWPCRCSAALSPASACTFAGDSSMTCIAQSAHLPSQLRCNEPLLWSQSWTAARPAQMPPCPAIAVLLSLTAPALPCCRVVAAHTVAPPA